MKNSENYGFNLPETTDFVDVEKSITENFENLDKALNEIEKEISNKAEAEHSHTEYAAVVNPVFAGNIAMEKTLASGNGSVAMGESVVANGDVSVAFGARNTVNGPCSFVHGSDSSAEMMYSLAMGYLAKAEDKYSLAYGYQPTSSGFNSISLGASSAASGDYSFAQGNKTVASGSATHAEGSNTTASGGYSHAEGSNTTASGNYSHAEGASAMSSGSYSHAEGKNTTALFNQHAQGHYNDTTLATANSSSGTSAGTAFVIGNGTSSAASNAFRVTGEGATYAKAAYNSTGADYAEFAEWADGNPDNEDRRGYFVTFDKEKPNMIRKANEGDYILGIVSGNPCIIGNSDEAWLGRYVFDEFGTPVYETTEQEETYFDEETGEEKTRTVEVTFYKLNPDYDPGKEYIHRKDRPEWDYIGWIGVLSVRDDGTCNPGGYCKAANGGTATTAERGTDTYRVLERVTKNIIKVAVK